MGYNTVFWANASLIKSLGEGNAHLVWVMGLYLEEPDLEALASEGLTDGNNDKKIDFIYLDRDGKRIVFAQGYYAENLSKNAAPANKASDLNTAAAWLLSGDSALVPHPLATIITACREALAEGDVESIELLYVHNLPESINVNRELQTAAAHMRKALGEDSTIRVFPRELGNSTIDHLFATQDSHIEVKVEIHCPAKAFFTETGPQWDASVLSVPGLWLHQLFSTHGEALFSANYRGFLGISKRRRINTGIRLSAENKPNDFWVYNTASGQNSTAHNPRAPRPGNLVFSTELFQAQSEPEPPARTDAIPDNEGEPRSNCFPAQLMDHLPSYEFQKCIARYCGDAHGRGFSAAINIWRWRSLS